MNLSPQEITQQLLMLPEQEQQEALDFIEFLHVKSARKMPKQINPVALKAESQADALTEGEKILKLMDEFGLIGCMEGDGKLSEDYKQHLWGNP